MSPNGRPKRPPLPSSTLASVFTVLLVLLASCDRRPGPAGTATRAGFVGSVKCGTCHAAEAAAWKASQHAVAMQEARSGTVLGRFDGTRVTFVNVTSTLLRRGDRSLVNTEGADGLLHDFEIRYTFGVWPLQQYLV